MSIERAQIRSAISGFAARCLLLLSIVFAGEVFAQTPLLVPGTRHEPGAHARSQIQLLHEDKQLRTRTEKKLDSQLLYALRRNRPGGLAPGLTTLKPALTFESDGNIRVDIEADVTPILLNWIHQNGGRVVSQFARYHAIRALVPLSLIPPLAAQPEVRHVRPADQAIAGTTSTDPEGDIAHRADQARQLFLADGTGVKIGVISDSLGGQTDSSPVVTVLPGQSGSGSGEGAAMLEIVHSLAPGANLYFATAFSSVAGFAQNILDLRAAGCTIIVDDVLYFNESPFQDGPIAQAVNDVSAAGVLFFSAAGNAGGLDRGTSGTWEGDFNDGGPATIGRGGRLHDFGGATGNVLLPAGSSQRVDLFWADPLGAATNDYDVYVVDASDSVIAASTNTQDGQSDPYESIPAIDPGDQIVIVKYSGAGRFLHLSTGRGVLQIPTAGATHGHSASGASNAFCIAATRVPNPPAPFVGGATNPVEAFSSDGPRHVFFNPDGTPITPGNYSATGGFIRSKPDLTAADGVSTSVPGFSPFFGTSAAAPHAAAIAGLLWSYNPNLNPAQVRFILTNTALKIAGPGIDRNSGAGIIMAEPALAAAPLLRLQSVSFHDANGNGIVDPDECVDIVVSLNNPTLQTMTGITAILTATSPDVLVDPSPHPFPDLAPGATGTATIPFRISTTAAFTCNSTPTFVLNLSASNYAGFPMSAAFALASPPPPAGAPMTFVSTNVPLAIPDLGTATSQVLAQGINTALAQVTLSVYITHTYDQDLRLSLIGPDGTTVILSTANGLYGQNYGQDCQYTTTFSDAATNAIDAASAPFLGTFQPEQPLAAFIGKFGAAVNGRWTLRVDDQLAEDVGTIQCWSLALSPLACFAGGGVCLLPPAIVLNPADQVATNGYLVPLAVVAQGTDPLAYQWYFNATNLIVGATNATLVLSNATPDLAGPYQVVLTNYYGSVTSTPALLTVVLPPSLLADPTNQVATNGDCVQWTVVAQGTAPLALQWYFNGTNLLAGATNATLILSNATLTQAGTYQVTATSPYGSVTSAPASLTIILPTLSCAPDRVVPLGTPWTFTPPLVSSGHTTLHVLLTVTNQGCGAAYQATRTWVLHGAGDFQAECSQTVQVVDTNGPVLICAPDKVVNFGNPWSFDVPHASYSSAITVVVYDNWTNHLAQLWDPGTAEVGSQITLDASARSLSQLAFEYWASNSTAGSLAATATVRVRFYQNDGPADLGNPPGTPLYDSGNLGIQATPDASFVLTQFQMGATVPLTGPLPDSFTWTVQFGGLGSNDAAGLWLYGPPVAGQSLGQWVRPADQTNWQSSGAGDFGGQLVAASQGVNLTLVGTVTNANCGLGYTAVQTWQATDACSNLATCAQTVVVVDARVPQLGNQPLLAQTVLAGDAATFSVDAFSCAALGFQWYLNATNLLVGATNSSLAFTTVTPDMAGNFQVVITNVYGSVTSAPVQLTVLSPPTLLGSPADQVAINGNLVQWTVVAQGTDPLAYQWYFNSTNLLGGATNAALVLSNATPDLAGSYAVVVTNFYGSVTSSPAQLTVVVPAGLLGNPADQMVTNGDTVQWAVVAQGTGPLAYQWYFNATNLLAGATNDLLVLSHASPALSGSYLVVITNAYGSVTSAPAQLTVVVPATLLLGPTDQVVTNGDTVVWSAVARGTAPLTYQWYFNATNLLSGGAGPTLILSNATPDMAGSYQVVVANAYGSATSALAQLTVVVPPGLPSVPADQVVTNGDTVQWTVSAQGTDPLVFQWYFNATNLLAGMTNATLALSNVTTALAGSYQVVVTNAFGSVTSAPVQLTVVVPATLLSNPADQTVTNGDTVVWTVAAQGTDPLAYQWYFNATNLLDGATNALLVYSNATPALAGTYQVVVANGYGSVTSAPAQLTVVVPATLLSGPADQTISDGDDVQWTVMAQGTDPLVYQWYFNTTNLLTSATNATLLLPDATPGLAGVYQVVVANAYGSVTSAPAALVIALPALTCSTNRLVPLGTPWDFDPPGVTGDRATLSVIGSVTNNGCGAAYSATRTWLLSGAGGFQASCSQTVQVFDTNGPVLTCAPDKVVNFGTPWSFDLPSASYSGAYTELVYDNWTNNLAQPWNPDTAEVGSQITLAGSARALRQLAFEYWATNGAGQSFAATAMVRVRLYLNDGPADAGNPPGTAIYDSGCLGLNPTPDGTFVLTQFQIGAAVPLTGPLPAAFTWTVQFGGLGSNDTAGLWLFGPPVAGQSLGQWARPADQTNWQTAGPGDFGGQLIAASQGVTLTFQGTVTNATCGQGYRAVQSWQAADACGNLATCAQTVEVLDLQPPQLVDLPPATQTVLAGAAAVFAVNAASCAPAAYQWYFNATNSLPGATNATLLLANATADLSGTYQVAVTNVYGSVTSAPVQLYVVIPAGLLGDPADQVATNGDTVQWTVSAQGTNPLVFQWYFNATNLLAGMTNATLVLSNVTTALAGSYQVVVTNAFGSVTSAPVQLTVVVPAALLGNPADQTVTNGDTIVWSVAAQGTDPLAYQWYFNATNLLDGATNALLVYSNATPALAGTYQVVVANGYGSVTSAPAQLTVVVPATLLSGPADQTISDGDDVQWTVMAQGTDPLVYQWYFNTTNLLTGATNATLLLPDATPGLAGVYQVVVANAYGSVTSAPAALVIALPALTCSTNRLVPLGTPWDFDPPGVTGDRATLSVIGSVTNNGCGAAYSATRTWLLSGAGGFQASCSQTVQVFDTNGPVLTCAPDKVVNFGTPWSFDLPSASYSGAYTELVYDNWTNNLAQPWNPDTAEVGSQITLAGSARALRQLAFEYWATNGAGQSFAATAMVRVRLYLNDGPADAGNPPGTAIYDSGCLGLNPTPDGTFVLTQFQIGAAVPLTGPLPAAFIWTVQFGGLGSNDTAGLWLFGPPVAGQSLGQWARPADQTNWQTAGPGDFGGQLIAASQGVTLTFQGTVTNATCGQGYRAVQSWQAADACGNLATCAQTVEVLDLQPPQLVDLPPATQTVLAGAAAVFAVNAASCAPAAYQWYFNATNSLPGATNATLLLANATTDLSGTYQVAVTNVYGSVTSAPVQLYVVIPAGLLGDPADQVATNGDTVQWTVSAQGTDPLVFQWYFNATNLLAGMTNATLVLSNVTTALAGSYQVVVTNAFGSVTSAPVQLTVAVPAALLGNPADQTVTKGDTIVWTVAAQGTDPLAYQWYFNATNLLDGATNALLVYSNATPALAGTYQVVVANGYGSVTSAPAQLIVIAPATLLSGPSDLVVTNGNTAQWTVVAQGTGPLAYQWILNTTNLLVGATNATLVLSNATPDLAGNYLIVVANAYGSVTSAPANLVVFAPPVIVSPPQNQTLLAGATATFSAAATGFPNPAYQWVFNGSLFLVGQTNASLVLTNVQDGLAGQYSALVSNFLGTTTSLPASLTVFDPPTITVPPQSVTVLQGDSITLTVTATGTDPLRYQWFVGGTKPISGATSSVFKLKHVTTLDSGSFSVAVSNAFGFQMSPPAFVRVLVTPTLLSLVRTGSTVSLQFSTVTNLLYSVDSSDNLAFPNWIPLPNASQLPGSGGPLTVSDPQPAVPNRFYRITVRGQ